MAESRPNGPIGNARERGWAYVSLLCVAVCLTISPQPSATAGGGIPCRYEVEIMPSPMCGTTVLPATGWAINNSNQVAGVTCTCFCGSDLAFSWTTGSADIFGGFPSGTFYRRANGINDAGIIVGEYDANGDGAGRLPFIRVGTAIGTLPVPPQPNNTVAVAINNRFQIAGYSTTAVNTALLWDGGRLVRIGDDLPLPYNAAYDVNDNGEVTGWMSTGMANNFQAYIWSNGQFTPIPNFRGGISTEGRAINNRGEVAGFSIVPFGDPDGFTFHGFLYSGGRTFDLGTLPGFAESRAFDVNDDGVVVGFCEGPGQRGFVAHNGRIVDLNDLIEPIAGLTITEAWSINEQGVIVGNAHQVTGMTVRLTPVPAALGDLTCDGAVNTLDLGILLSSWSIPFRAPGCDAQPACPSDLNHDGLVNTLDLGILLANWTP